MKWTQEQRDKALCQMAHIDYRLANQDFDVDVYDVFCQRNDLLEALKWCENHLRMIEEEDFPNVNPDARMFNSRRSALAAIAKAESK